MATIDVSCNPAVDGWACSVVVTEPGGSTRHEVTLQQSDLARLAPTEKPDELVRRAFEFLLAREPGESILRSFDLMAIARYFPEFEAEIRRS
jgi:hypothetical protein